MIFSIKNILNNEEFVFRQNDYIPFFDRVPMTT